MACQLLKLGVLEKCCAFNRLLFALLIVAAKAPGAEVIGTNSLLNYDDTLFYREVVNNKPGNGATVTLNPPLFSWLYDNTNLTAGNYIANEFQFQCAYDSSFVNPVVNVRTVYNFYNFINHFTNSPVYWRIGYISDLNRNLTNWSTTRRFTIAPNATVWDRGMFADENFLQANDVHPRLGFRKNNKAAITAALATDPDFKSLLTQAKNIGAQCQSNWFFVNASSLSTNVRSIYLTNGTVVKYAPTWASSVQIITEIWPNAVFYSNPKSANGRALTSPTNALAYVWRNQASWDAGDPFIAWTKQDDATSLSSLALYLSYLGFAWQMTGDTTITNHAPEVLRYVAQTFAVTYGQVIGDYDVAAPTWIAQAYDWLWDISSPAQRKSVVDALSLRARFLYGETQMLPYKGGIQQFFYGTNASGVRLCYIGNAGKFMESHTYANMSTMINAALAGYGDSVDLRKLFDGYMNYLIAIGTPYGNGENGFKRMRGYGQATLAGLGLYTMWPQIAMTFPDQEWRNHPGIHGMPEFLRWFTPVGYRLNGHDTWGDGGYGHPGSPMDQAEPFWQSDYAKYAVQLAGSSVGEFHRQQTLIAKRNGPNSYCPAIATLNYFYPPPTTNVAVLTNTAKVFPYGGYAFGLSKPPSSSEAFSNGVGFIFQASPQSGDDGATFASDLELEFWAYGARVTAGGGPYDSSWEETSFSRNVVSVDNQPMTSDKNDSTGQPWPKRPYHGKMLAFQQGSNYVYVAGSGTQNYFRAPQVTKAERHVLFMRNKYLVIYDDMASRLKSTYAWQWHVQEPTLANVTAAGFQYTSTNLYSGRSAVTTLVRHITSDLGFKRIDRGATTIINGKYYNPVIKHPFSGETFDHGSQADAPYFRSHALYFTNSFGTTNWHFMTVVYPVYAGEALPQITRLDNYTVAVTNGNEGDVISFDRSTTHPATLIVNLSVISDNKGVVTGGVTLRPVKPNGLVLRGL